MLNQAYKTPKSQMFSFEQPGNVWEQPGAQGREWDMSRLLNMFLPGARDQANFANQLEPFRQSSILNTINTLSPGNRQSLVDQYRRKATARAKDQARNSALLGASRGFGSGATQGAELDALNQAARASNDYDAQLNSPEGVMQALAAIMAAVGEGQNSNMLSQVLSLVGPASMTDQMALQRPQGQSGLGALLQGVGGIAGMFTGGGRQPEQRKPLIGPGIFR